MKASQSTSADKEADNSIRRRPNEDAGVGLTHASGHTAVQHPGPPHLPTGLGTRSLRQAMVLQMQRKHGNKHVQRLMSNDRTRVSRPNQTGVQLQTETTTTPSSLIVEDDAAELQTGQMRKSEFLAQLREAVCATADEALSGTIFSSVGCPYIARIFSRLPGRSANYIEQGLQRFAPGSRGATSAAEYVAPVTERVRAGIANWLQAGQLPEMPEGFAGMEGAAAATGQTENAINRRVDDTLQRLAEPIAIQRHLGEGRRLDGGIRARMEKGLGRPIGDVTIHTGASAASLARQQDARAFAVGRHVVFGAGQYQPGTLVGDAILAHELAHVAQQDGAAPDRSSSIQRAQPANDPLERQADLSAAGAVVSLYGGMTNVFANALPVLRSGLRIQRCDDQGKKQAEAFFWGVVSGLGPPGMPTPDPDAARGAIEIILGFAKKDYQSYCLFGSHMDDRFSTVDWGWYQREARRRGLPVDVDNFYRSIRPLFLEDLWNNTVHRGDSGNICS